MSLAPPEAVWLSATVRELIEGTDLESVDRGPHELKGIPGERHLYELVQPRTGRSTPLASGH